MLTAHLPSGYVLARLVAQRRCLVPIALVGRRVGRLMHENGIQVVLASMFWPRSTDTRQASGM